MTDQTVSQLARVEKPPRPPHVILLADVIDRTLPKARLGGLVVAWYELDADGHPYALKFETLGANDELACICERTKLAILAGRLTAIETRGDPA